MKKGRVKKLVVAALFAALTCVATMVLTVPLLGNGYANLGDCFVVLSGCLLGPVWGVVAAAIGSSLADLLLGYAIYAPATFVIKGLMALVAYAAFQSMNKVMKKQTVLSVVAAAVMAEILMVVGYFVFEWFAFGAAVAMADVWGNSIQGAVGMAASVVLPTMAIYNKQLRTFFELNQ